MTNNSSGLKTKYSHGGVSKRGMNLLCLFPNEHVVIDVAINGRQKDFDFSPFWYQVMDLVQPFLEKEYQITKNKISNICLRWGKLFTENIPRVARYKINGDIHTLKYVEESKGMIFQKVE